jgi:hypothetical protein
MSVEQKKEKCMQITSELLSRSTIKSNFFLCTPQISGQTFDLPSMVVRTATENYLLPLSKRLAQ